MLTLGTVVLGVDDFPRAKQFWMAALGHVPRDPGDDTFVVLADPEGNRFCVIDTGFEPATPGT